MSSQPQNPITPEKFLNAVLEGAVRDRASDVHIEPISGMLRVRFRIDGYLQERYQRPLEEIDPLVTRIKAISNLDIASHLPQDGHFEFSVELTQGLAPPQGDTAPQTAANPGGVAPTRLSHALSSLFGAEGDAGKKQPQPWEDEKNDRLEPEVAPSKPRQHGRPAGTYVLNVRVSVFPTVYGEAVVFRLLNRSEMLIPLEKLGMNREDLVVVRDLISRSYGMVLTTGPSGAGKSTTLYAILQELKQKEKNIVTLEDPVEFYFGDIRQTQIRPEQGLTYAVGMKSILRQDPDVLMIGEIRDHETAEYAMRASLIGRIVGSTVHSNTTVGTIARLIDMDVERSLIAYAVSGVISQRLVRKICASCPVEYAPDVMFLERLGIARSAEQRYLKGGGCAACDGAGFNGRTGIYSVLRMDDELRSLIVERAPLKALQDYTEKSGTPTLRQRAAEKVLAGETTAEEAVLVV